MLHGPLSSGETLVARSLMRVAPLLDASSNAGLKQPEHDGSSAQFENGLRSSLLDDVRPDAVYCMIHEPRYQGTSLVTY